MPRKGRQLKHVWANARLGYATMAHRSATKDQERYGKTVQTWRTKQQERFQQILCRKHRTVTSDRDFALLAKETFSNICAPPNEHFLNVKNNALVLRSGNCAQASKTSVGNNVKCLLREPPLPQQPRCKRLGFDPAQMRCTVKKDIQWP